MIILQVLPCLLGCPLHKIQQNIAFRTSFCASALVCHKLSFAAAYHSSQVFSLLSIIFLALNLLLLFIFCSLSRIMKPVDRPRVVLERSHSTFKYLCVHPPTELFKELWRAHLIIGSNFNFAWLFREISHEGMINYKQFW